MSDLPTDQKVVDRQVPGVAVRAFAYWPPDGSAVQMRNYVLLEDYIAIERENKVLQLKANNSLANNLCSDHFDKQVGKPCLACEIERLSHEPKKGLPQSMRVQIERAIEEAIRPAGMSTHDGKAKIGADVLKYLLALADSGSFETNERCPHGFDLKTARCMRCENPAFDAAAQIPLNTGGEA